MLLENHLAGATQMKRNLSLTLPALVLLGGLSFAGTVSEASAQTLPEGVTAAMITTGKTVFDGAGACYTCHGPAGAGTGLAPSLADTKWLHSDGSYLEIVKTVTAGVPAPKESMIPMLAKGGSQITEEQIKAVSAYVWSISHK
jgi:mono/diheme cytochrome c family protein